MRRKIDIKKKGIKSGKKFPDATSPPPGSAEPQLGEYISHNASSPFFPCPGRKGGHLIRSSFWASAGCASPWMV